MYRNLLLLLFILCLAEPLLAQRSITFGPVVGGNYTQPIFDYYVPSSFDGADIGFSGGVFIRFDFSKRLYLQPSVIFSTKNITSAESTSLAEDYYYSGNTSYLRMQSFNSRINFNYTEFNSVRLSDLDIPIMINFKIINHKLFNFRVGAGPVVSFNLGSQGIDSIRVYNDGNNPVKRNHFGYKFGLGVDVAKFTFDIAYQGIVTPELANTRPNYSPKLNFVQILIGYKIR